MATNKIDAGQPNHGERLDSWKEIADYLHRGVRTVQRWELTRGLPVHRLPGGKRGAICADTSELEAWWHNQGAQLEKQESERKKTKRRRKWLWPAALLVVGAGLTVWFLKTWPIGKQHGEQWQPVPITNFLGRETHPSLSPDGRRVAYAWAGEKCAGLMTAPADIYVRQIGGEALLQLTDTPEHEFDPVWSPDGLRIAFSRVLPLGSGTGPTYTLHVIDALGGLERTVGESMAHRWSLEPMRMLAWSPDGEFLAVTDRESPQEPEGMFLLSIKSHEKRRLTSAPAESLGDWFPSFSPDGRALAFLRFGKKEAVRAVYVLPLAEGGSPASVASRLTTGKPLGLAWAADGKDIVFAEPPLGLWRVAAFGGEPYRLNIGVRPHSVSISRRGGHMVYSEAEPVNVNIWRVAGPNATGRGPSGSAASPSRFISSTALDYSPRYSPDGAKTAFFSEREGGRRLWLSDSGGSRLLRLAGLKEWTEGWCANPRWSPDGRYIAFDCNSEGNHDIYVARAAGGAPRRITFDPAADECPSWSKDGEWIYFGSTRSGEFEIWKMSAEGGTAEQVTRKGGKEPFESADGRFIYYAKKWPTLGIWRVPVTGGEETRVLDEGSEAMWDLHPDGILFRAGRPEDGPTIEFYRFATRRVELIKKLPEGTLTHHGLNVSPDGRWILYAQVDRRESDIMLVEDFPR